ncbi:ERV/ALR sulfhydryl oxidase [Mucor lusitanicus]|uniref:Sulfhydryl oxidase n=2 Tax=Mucor circinelloides f. lusitanicus TaxID=29924 RepID=A0A8H4B5R7_MUCCL|nr:ERV/ALR sulfhydryl oxidase domain-containing protein [Mucor lusitanicus]KAF1802470.1 ERV/ALR sulfhydryl oxidase domain-containing protein [Mucor lusitanicus]
MLKRQSVLASVGLFLLIFVSILFVYTSETNSDTHVVQQNQQQSSTFVPDAPNFQSNDKIIMDAMGNQTERAELGRATWKFLHTMMARYPEKPSKEERKSLHDFMMLFSTLYPCGECANHFNKLITTYPPQTSSRFSASQWLCAMHNKVNERLKKPIFDCNDIESKYPCGCATTPSENDSPSSLA